VCGSPQPERGAIVSSLARDPGDRRRVIVTPDGAPCETRYEVVDSHDGYSILRCELVTGRTHQIRVHLASRGWPIVGDQIYGEPDARIARQALHAWRVSLPHPITRQALEFEAPLAADIRDLIQNFTL
jgi:23S rRNA pseudouridine1911/1915/1917 synthase